MSKKNHPPAPVPPGNRPHDGPAYTPKDDGATPPTDDGAAFSEQDEKRRLGNFTTAGEHARVQPGPRNDGGGHPAK